MTTDDITAADLARLDAVLSDAQRGMTLGWAVHSAPALVRLARAVVYYGQTMGSLGDWDGTGPDPIDAINCRFDDALASAVMELAPDGEG